MKNLFVGNLPFSVTESDLRNLFEEHGAVERVTVVTDRDTGKPRGFAFVEMTDEAAADKAISALNGRELEGRALSVSEARPRADRGDTRGRGGKPGGSRGPSRPPRGSRW